MANGYSLHVGLDFVNSDDYNGSEWPLDVAVKDMISMRDLAAKQKFKTTCLQNEEATISAFISGVRSIKDKVKAGDIFLLTYAGHGYQTKDQNGDEEEGDGKDENLCLFDGLFVDDKLNELFCEFPAGVRILVVSDCCHGGSIHKYGLADTVEEVPTEEQDEPLASVILLSGTADNQEAYEGEENGRFTECLLEVWDEGEFEGNYLAFKRAIKKKIRRKYGAQQSVMLSYSGPHGIIFKEQIPFTI
ncbi:MAG: caspase family protein [Bacteroidota bacterium]